jgi:hypothetical protein
VISPGQVEIDLLLAEFLGIDLGDVVDRHLRHEQLRREGILSQDTPFPRSYVPFC